MARVDARLPLHRLDGAQTYLVAWDGDEPVGHAHIAWHGTKLGIPEVKRLGPTGWRSFAGVSIHDLRRSAIRNMRRGGVEESVAMTITGHKSSQVFRRYDITSHEDQRRALQAAESYRQQRRAATVTPLTRTKHGQ